MIDRLDEILGDCLDADLAAEPEALEQHWLDEVRDSVDRLGIHAWNEHLVAGGLHEGRTVVQCARTVQQVIEEAV